MRIILQTIALATTVVALSHCETTTYVDPGVAVSPEPTTSSTTTTQTTANPYTGESVTTKKTTTTYR